MSASKPFRSVANIRSAFLNYFAAHGHNIVPSSPLVPEQDPTLLFTNAGMVQFKNAFTGLETPPYQRAATSQKCVRAGGKHNDLEQVGYTARHHTFFEMLGNFSFGDYFKEEAIHLAWDLITQTFQIPKEKLCVTVYADDHEAFGLWKSIAGLDENKIIRIATDDNFWSMGETGPCGPCSEIFYDHGAHIPGGPPGSPDQDGDRFVEIWNLVFMQFEKMPDGSMVPLPRPSIDTGMGLERIAAVLQGKHNNYDTDIFQEIIDIISNFTDKPRSGEWLASYRVIADHLRASCFLMADGVMPSNEGRGYVLRRIMRRAMRHVHRLDIRDPVLYRLVPTLVDAMGQAYPELSRSQSMLMNVLTDEESRFQQTLDRGMMLLTREMEKLGSGQSLPGDVAFRLYDTYGFPLDLTQDILREHHHGVDVQGFEQAMTKQKDEARKSWAGSGEVADDRLWFEIAQSTPETKFLGYDNDRIETTTILELVMNNQRVEQVEQGQEVQLVVHETPFYPEGGGQQGDQGWVFALGSTQEMKIRVLDTQKMAGKLIVHRGIVESGFFRKNQMVVLEVDENRRQLLRTHHSVTHLLHRALREVLGDHVTQKGSLVAADRLRFDFSHSQALDHEQLDKIEDWVNARIMMNVPVKADVMTPDQAMAKGALALFGEKYGERVRVIQMGDGETLHSMELCGGTHVERTGDIGFFKIIQESGIAAGIRRIEAVAGQAAIAVQRKTEQQLQTICNALKSSPRDVLTRLEKLIQDKSTLEQQLRQIKKDMTLGSRPSEGKHSRQPSFETIGNIRFLPLKVDGMDVSDLRSMMDQAKSQIQSGIVALFGCNDGKISFMLGITKDLHQSMDATHLIRELSPLLGGKGGGGRPDLAQAGGHLVDNIPQVIETLRSKIRGISPST